jgi:hypothetical protein
MANPLAAQVLDSGSGRASTASSSASAAARLPQTTEEIDRALSRIEKQRSEVRERGTAAIPEATPEQEIERQHLFQQWLSALDSHARSLQRLKEIRALNQDRAAEAEAWRGFAEKPPYSLMLVEELRDAIAEQGLEAQTARMLLSISENGVARAAILLEDGRKQVRLAHDRVESAGAPIQRQRWLLQLAEIRVQSNQATIEAAELERQVTLENLTGLQKYLEFLERNSPLPRAVCSPGRT